MRQKEYVSVVSAANAYPGDCIRLIIVGTRGGTQATANLTVDEAKRLFSQLNAAIKKLEAAPISATEIMPTGRWRLDHDRHATDDQSGSGSQRNRGFGHE